ncbi:hypothetical protein KEM48_005333 [Puccinia striiformis f. sp. tritici PST-130]|nr:hypothetical protein KEM48_005333 [Puccinia striiformis f. sp. tritici PST-130]
MLRSDRQLRTQWDPVSSASTDQTTSLVLPAIGSSRDLSEKYTTQPIKTPLAAGRGFKSHRLAPNHIVAFGIAPDEGERRNRVMNKPFNPVKKPVATTKSTKPLNKPSNTSQQPLILPRVPSNQGSSKEVVGASSFVTQTWTIPDRPKPGRKPKQQDVIQIDGPVTRALQQAYINSLEAKVQSLQSQESEQLIKKPTTDNQLEPIIVEDESSPKESKVRKQVSPPDPDSSCSLERIGTSAKKPADHLCMTNVNFSMKDFGSIGCADSQACSTLKSSVWRIVTTNDSAMPSPASPETEPVLARECNGNPKDCPACRDDPFGQAFCAALNQATATQEPISNSEASTESTTGIGGVPTRKMRGQIQSWTLEEEIKVPCSEAWRQLKAHPNIGLANLQLLADVVARNPRQVICHLPLLLCRTKFFIYLPPSKPIP